MQYCKRKTPSLFAMYMLSSTESPQNPKTSRNIKKFKKWMVLRSTSKKPKAFLCPSNENQQNKIKKKIIITRFKQQMNQEKNVLTKDYRTYNFLTFLTLADNTLHLLARKINIGPFTLISTSIPEHPQKNILACLICILVCTSPCKVLITVLCACTFI